MRLYLDRWFITSKPTSRHCNRYRALLVVERLPYCGTWSCFRLIRDCYFGVCLAYSFSICAKRKNVQLLDPPHPYFRMSLIINISSGRSLTSLFLVPNKGRHLTNDTYANNYEVKQFFVVPITTSLIQSAANVGCLYYPTFIHQD